MKRVVLLCFVLLRCNLSENQLTLLKKVLTGKIVTQLDLEILGQKISACGYFKPLWPIYYSSLTLSIFFLACQGPQIRRKDY